MVAVAVVTSAVTIVSNLIQFILIVVIVNHHRNVCLCVCVCVVSDSPVKTYYIFTSLTMSFLHLRAFYKLTTQYLTNIVVGASKSLIFFVIFKSIMSLQNTLKKHTQTQRNEIEWSAWHRHRQGWS